MGDEKRDLEAIVKHLQDLLNFIISFTDSNGEHQKDVEQHDLGETHQQQKKTVTSPFNAPFITNQQVQNNINLPWMVRQQNRFMLVLQELCTLYLDTMPTHERARRLPWPNKSFTIGL